MTELHRVVLPWAVYGVVVRGGQIVDSAPIGRKFIGQPLFALQRWVRRKGGTVKQVTVEGDRKNEQ
jgi:hypothetical protein